MCTDEEDIECTVCTSSKCAMSTKEEIECTNVHKCLSSYTMSRIFKMFKMAAPSRACSKHSMYSDVPGRILTYLDLS